MVGKVLCTGVGSFPCVSQGKGFPLITRRPMSLAPSVIRVALLPVKVEI